MSAPPPPSPAAALAPRVYTCAFHLQHYYVLLLLLFLLSEPGFYGAKKKGKRTGKRVRRFFFFYNINIFFHFKRHRFHSSLRHQRKGEEQYKSERESGRRYDRKRRTPLHELSTPSRVAVICWTTNVRHNYVSNSDFYKIL